MAPNVRLLVLNIIQLELFDQLDSKLKIVSITWMPNNVDLVVKGVSGKLSHEIFHTKIMFYKNMKIAV